MVILLVDGSHDVQHQEPPVIPILVPHCPHLMVLIKPDWLLAHISSSFISGNVSVLCLIALLLSGVTVTVPVSLYSISNGKESLLLRHSCIVISHFNCKNTKNPRKQMENWRKSAAIRYCRAAGVTPAYHTTDLAYPIQEILLYLF